ncbi:metal-sensitive transcriptional regulator [Marispirochaeta aestuarii]|uniref:metal-sensitive transcriptional regulator n=1 Tax=Marispirochaeta aestuarii TaxID=1963862 RepID=UPI0029C6D28E|nr:metal-sensitive transcriptional regulator [Marispirochaeta aestuarii]
MMNQKQKEDVQRRLGKIEGQIRGISKMVETDRYCMDILSQVRAVVSAIRKVEDLVMDQHLHTCVADSMRHGDEADQNEKIAEIMDMLSRFRRIG